MNILGADDRGNVWKTESGGGCAPSDVQQVVSDALLPCPFCGSEPRAVRNTEDGACQIFCVCEPEPFVMRAADEFDAARAAWNHRQPFFKPGEKSGFGGVWKFHVRGGYAFFELPHSWDLADADLVLDWLDLIRDQIQGMVTD